MPLSTKSHRKLEYMFQTITRYNLLYKKRYTMAFPEPLSENSISKNPFLEFNIWLEERSRSFTGELNAVNLATASAEGRVSVRTVLIKEYDEKGFVFYTNYNSKKGEQLTANPFAALLFYWPESGRQIRVEGFVDRVPAFVSDEYFQMRPHGSQIAAVVSDQSSVIPDRKYLEDLYVFHSKLFEGKRVDRPAHWGGYILNPSWFEFWQEGEHRLHDRISYSRITDGWRIERLAP
jgi:pyridoxamine 5'-phosphate oxidase